MSHQESNYTVHEVTEKLRSSGLKITEARKELVSTILTFKNPFTADDVQHALTDMNYKVHRATVYRDLLQFIQVGVLKELIIKGSSAHYYELETNSHHHHFVCQVCLRMTDVTPDKVETALHEYEVVLQQSGLQVNTHQLKFYGVCQACQKVQ